MKFKGFNLTIQAVLFLALGLFLAIILFVFFIDVFTPGGERMDLAKRQTDGCSEWIKFDPFCEDYFENTQINYL